MSSQHSVALIIGVIFIVALIIAAANQTKRTYYLGCAFILMLIALSTWFAPSATH